ncbi:MAG: penicillin acylase family protein [Pseudonocardia sp.]|uniref:penicillin acylase family protein n=1 Tax=unclassified Pseudonocardia TaxID=2619320 RepID=UPI00086C4B22|nr:MULTISPECIES: penicillin acylase family protein [unclassified Pseudonocardia]MBN9113660.1 penicillin acylase family protein [Pseudonocardia sp.]ODU24493.1 MAG: PbsX family transcriptional regulator [Pseudonocardia sp. SCN 72-51]ODU99429.1 MAG: PbsX family transcriptional regulator [Pseudonocardia sp. SCN 73-27]
MSQQDTPADRQVHVVAGLESSVETLIDRWGVAHIYASSSHDAFFAQGFNAARDRLWQIDLWRRRGLGLLSEVFGPQFVERDRAARLFLFRGDMRQEWLAYGSDTKRIATAFVAGVNAYVDLVDASPELLPPEFRRHGYLPARWHPEDVARIRSHGLFQNVREEVARARTIRDYGVAVEELRKVREPYVPLTVPDGLDLDAIPDDVLDVYELATTYPDFDDPARVPSSDAVLMEGSNNWVLGGQCTSTGRPIVANDPHRALSLPSLRYLVHLNAPSFSVIGGGEPALPGVSIGHNGAMAFGMTLFSVDQEDLYVYELDPADPLQYRYMDGWERLRVQRCSVPVRGGDDVEVELAFTRHGPVVRATETHAFAVRAAWLEPGMAPYLGSVDYMRATDFESFGAAMNRWGAPAENQIYADVHGNIAWKAAGLTPRRPNWDGTLPVPGDGRFEWDGFHDADELPGIENPEIGWFASANEMNLPADHPVDRTVTHDWYAPDRKQRIDAAISEGLVRSVNDAARLQGDVTSLPAQRILRVLRGLVDDATPALALLRGWDGVLDASSAAAALFEVWHRRHLRPAVLAAALRHLLPAADVDEALARLVPDESLLADSRVLLSLVEEPAERLGPDPADTLRDVMTSSLESAYEDCASLLGDDPSEWAWGRLHVSILRHPLGLTDERTGEAVKVGPLPRGGSGDTVCDTAYNSSFVQTGGSTFRVVIDVGNWDGSLALNHPGQSGAPTSPHFDDLADGWANGRYFPLLYSRFAVESATESVYELQPPA